MKPDWIKTADQLPERKPGVKYSQVPCLVVKDGQVMILVFNHEHECWDGEDGDDYECEIMAVEKWILLPKA